MAFADNYQVLFSVMNKIINKESSKEYTLKNLLNLQDLDGNTAIHYAAYRGNMDIVKLLIKYGADYQKKNNSGLNVMHMAAQGDRPNILIYFKDKYNMDINQKDFNGSTPLHWACHLGSEKAVTFILSWTDDIDIQDTKGKTALYLAVQATRVKIIQKLIRKGADTYIRDNTQKNIYDVVADNPTMDNIYRLLFDYKNTEYTFSLCKSKRNYENANNNNYVAMDISERPKNLLPKKSSNITYERNIVFILLAIISEFSTIILLLPYIGNYYISSIGFILALLLLIAYIKMSNSDPGFMVTKYNKTWLQLVEENIINIKDFCPYCKVEKTSENIKHCHICGHCVDAFDHHCHWINNCVGENNSGLFMVFLVILILNILFNYFIALTAYIIGLEYPDKHADVISIRILGFPLTATARDYLAIIIMTISIIFIVPICYVFYTQIKNRNERQAKNLLIRSR